VNKKGITLPNRFKRNSTLAAVALSQVFLTPYAFGQGLDFNRDVRRILSDNCFFCHGPDKQESDLRLDLSEVAYRKKAIVPGKPESSELFARITSDDPEYRMPPPDSNRTLSAIEVDKLAQWIREGANYKKHWAFTSIASLASLENMRSTIRHDDWSQNPLDEFVIARLREESLSPSAPASPERILRRVTLDLTGLPPTIPEIDAFLEDESPGAYEAVVDRLLASPAFGEQMALPWLDLARYADTFGFDNDREMHMWPWRDWVIQAFNENLPYDDFLRWQLAGDLLPSPTHDQLLATAFNRLHRQNAEGGALPEEFIVEYVSDRTQTFATAFLGITLECAKCHDHKFDPISQKNYYALTAYFNNIDEAGVYAEKTGATPTPNTFLYQGDQKKRHQDLKRAIIKAEEALARVRSQAKERFKDSQDSPVEPILHLPFDSRDKLPGSAILVDGPSGQAVQFSGDEGVKLDKTGAFERTDSFTISAWLRPSDENESMVICHNSKPNWEAGSRGLEFILEHGRVEFGLSHFWPGNAIRTVSKRRLKPNEWTHVAISYNGSSRAGGITVFFDGVVVPVEVMRDNLYSTIRFSGNPPPMVIGARRSELGFRNGAVDEFLLFDQCLSSLEIAQLHSRTTKASKPDLLNHYADRIDGDVGQSRGQLLAARQAENAFVGSLRSIMVMRDKKSPASASVLERGAYDQPGETVSPGIPAAILPTSPDQLPNRLGLVDWLTRRDHPLTARIAVNRVWSNFFGRGLVETDDDFGNQGSPPSHPELLDFLAAWFTDSGWDVKALCKLIVTSSTYRQDSAGHPQFEARDPENILLARGPKHRLKAEQIRDAALSACGLLARRVGGPSVKPYQPGGLWKETGPQTYKADTGENLYRRSLYTFWKRTVPPPTMLSFDAVSREVCVARRESTVTPAQALILLNDPQFVEPARVLAGALLEDSTLDRPDSIDRVFRRLTGRRPRAAEHAELLEAFEQQHRLFAAAKNDAEAYISVGQWPVDASLDPAEVAAMTAVVQIVMNFHEFQMKQ
jgi:hypothetical protein